MYQHGNVKVYMNHKKMVELEEKLEEKVILEVINEVLPGPEVLPAFKFDLEAKCLKCDYHASE